MKHADLHYITLCANHLYDYMLCSLQDNNEVELTNIVKRYLSRLQNLTTSIQTNIEKGIKLKKSTISEYLKLHTFTFNYLLAKKSKLVYSEEGKELWNKLILALVCVWGNKI